MLLRCFIGQKAGFRGIQLNLPEIKEHLRVTHSDFQSRFARGGHAEVIKVNRQVADFRIRPHVVGAPRTISQAPLLLLVGPDLAAYPIPFTERSQKKPGPLKGHCAHELLHSCGATPPQLAWPTPSCLREEATEERLLRGTTVSWIPRTSTPSPERNTSLSARVATFRSGLSQNDQAQHRQEVSAMIADLEKKIESSRKEAREADSKLEGAVGALKNDTTSSFAKVRESLDAQT